MCRFKTRVLPYKQPWLGMARLALLLISSDMTPITAGRIAWSAPDDSRGDPKGCPTNRLMHHARLVHVMPPSSCGHRPRSPAAKAKTCSTKAKFINSVARKLLSSVTRAPAGRMQPGASR